MTLISKHSQFDVAIVGAGVSGTAAAILLQEAGFSVLLVDKRQSIQDYKPLCTHFVQPFANNVFTDLGMAHLLDAENSVRTKAAFHVPGGVIDTDRAYGDDPVTSHAHNLERRVMDPALRKRAQQVGVTLAMGIEVTALTNGANGQELTLSDGTTDQTVTAQFVVAADGRASRLADLTDAPMRKLPNDRAAYFCYCKGIAAPARNRSLFVLRNSEMSFLYPLIDGRTLLSVYITADRAEAWGSGRTAWPHLLAQFQAHLPEMDFSSAQPDTQVFSYRRYENQIRNPVTKDIPFIGDAVVSIDPMSGVGCSFGLKAARLLADAMIANRNDLAAACAAYAQAHSSFFDAHVQGITADSRVMKTDEAVAATYAPILQSPKLQQQYLDLTARLITPAEFQRSYMMFVARRAQHKPVPKVLETTA